MMVLRLRSEIPNQNGWLSWQGRSLLTAPCLCAGDRPTFIRHQNPIGLGQLLRQQTIETILQLKSALWNRFRLSHDLALVAEARATQ